MEGFSSSTHPSFQPKLAEEEVIPLHYGKTIMEFVYESEKTGVTYAIITIK